MHLSKCSALGVKIIVQVNCVNYFTLKCYCLTHVHMIEDTLPSMYVEGFWCYQCRVIADLLISERNFKPSCLTAYNYSYSRRNG